MVSYKIAKSMYIRKRNTVVDSYGWLGRSKDMAKGGKGICISFKGKTSFYACLHSLYFINSWHQNVLMRINKILKAGEKKN